MSLAGRTLLGDGVAWNEEKSYESKLILESLVRLEVWGIGGIFIISLRMP
jgi:hypothetical protein